LFRNLERLLGIEEAGYGEHHPANDRELGNRDDLGGGLERPSHTVEGRCQSLVHEEFRGRFRI